MGKPTHGRKETELLQDIMENKTYVQIKDLDRKAWNKKSRKSLLESAQDQKT